MYLNSNKCAKIRISNALLNSLEKLKFLKSFIKNRKTVILLLFYINATKKKKNFMQLLKCKNVRLFSLILRKRPKNVSPPTVGHRISHVA